MNTHENCPHCGSDLRGEAIPEETAHYYAGTHFWRYIGHTVRGTYDGTLFWSCPDCGLAWERDFGTYGTKQQAASARYVTEWNETTVREAKKEAA